MKKLIILLTGLGIFLINIMIAHECAQVHNTDNVGHQFYEALIETPKDAIVKSAVATKELGKDVVAAIAHSNAPSDFKQAAKELVIETPVKTAEAVKNGTLKAVEGTKKGAQSAYNTIIRRPITKIKNAATHVANKVYHVIIEKPVGAVKAAAHYLAHADDNLRHDQYSDICVMVLPTPLMVSQNSDDIVPSTIAKVTTVAVMPLSWVNGSKQFIATDNQMDHDEIDLEFILETPCQLHDDEYELSEKTLKRLAKAYQSLNNDIIAKN